MKDQDKLHDRIHAMAPAWSRAEWREHLATMHGLELPAEAPWPVVPSTHLRAHTPLRAF